MSVVKRDDLADVLIEMFKKVSLRTGKLGQLPLFTDEDYEKLRGTIRTFLYGEDEGT